MKLKTYSVIMAGGSGTRFWPESTRSHPKQYLRLIGEKSLLEGTLDRFQGLIPAEQVSIVTVRSQRDLVQEHSSSTGNLAIVLEPAARNTAPCILLALANLLEHAGASEKDAIGLFAADHVILNKGAFQETLRRAVEFIEEKDQIITIGITPHFPHTGYGYIWRGSEWEKLIYRTKGFKEKPNFATAEKYLASGEYYWNSGMFIARIGVLLEEFKEHAPSLYNHWPAIREAVRSQDNDRLHTVYQKLEAISIDYAVMEKSQRISVIPATFDWNDLGSWDALAEVLRPEKENFLVSNNAHLFAENAKGNIIRTHKEQMVVLIDVNDLVVVNDKKALLVMPKSSSQKVKKVVESLQERKQDDLY